MIRAVRSDRTPSAALSAGSGWDRLTMAVPPTNDPRRRAGAGNSVTQAQTEARPTMMPRRAKRRPRPHRRRDARLRRRGPPQHSWPKSVRPEAARPMTLASYVRASRAWHHAINKHSKIRRRRRGRAPRARCSRGAPVRGRRASSLPLDRSPLRICRRGRVAGDRGRRSAKHGGRLCWRASMTLERAAAHLSRRARPNVGVRRTIVCFAVRRDREIASASRERSRRRRTIAALVASRRCRAPPSF